MGDVLSFILDNRYFPVGIQTASAIRFALISTLFFHLRSYRYMLMKQEILNILVQLLSVKMSLPG